MEFTVDNHVKSLGIDVVFLVIHNINNHETSLELQEIYKNYYSNILENSSYELIKNNKQLIGYDDLHKAVEVYKTELLASPQSLFKMLFDKKRMAQINYLVDIYNYISMKNLISIGAHDFDKINGNIRLSIAKDNEKFIPLGTKKKEPVSPGEYCYFDDSNEIICRLDCKQCNKTKITDHTKSTVIVIQGNNHIISDSLVMASNELIHLLSKNGNPDLDYYLSIL